MYCPLRFTIELAAALALAACSAPGAGAREESVAVPATTARPAPQPSPFLAATLRNPHFHWRTVESAHFRVHAAEGTWAAERLDSLGLAAETARVVVLAALGASADSVEPKPELFFLTGPEDFRALVGQPAGGWTEPQANTVLLGASATGAPPLRHELAHLYSHRRWGPPHAAWVSEGVAVHGVGGCAGAPLDAWALAVRNAGLSTPWSTLEARFDFTKAAPHLEAGSVVRFIRERYGLAVVRSLWRDGLPGAARAARESAAVLEAQWRGRVAQADRAVAAELDPRGRVRCETGR